MGSSRGEGWWLGHRALAGSWQGGSGGGVAPLLRIQVRRVQAEETADLYAEDVRNPDRSTATAAAAAARLEPHAQQPQQPAAAHQQRHRAAEAHQHPPHPHLRAAGHPVAVLLWCS